MTRIVVSLLPSTVDTGLEQVRRAQRAGAEMVELRLDHFRRPDDVAALVRGSPAPVLASCRVKEDGGFFLGDPDLRRRLLLAAAESGAEWVDLEHWESLCLPAGLRTRVLRSYHRLQEAPRDLDAIVDRMAKSSADALKVTWMGYDAADLEIANRLYERRYPVPLVAFLAGPSGTASRLLALLRGAPFLYVAPGPGQATAPGQPDLYQALELYRAPALGQDSCFWGLCGSPVEHSLGYRLHNGLDRFLRDVPAYLPFDTKHPDRLLRALRAFGPRFLGLSVTAPLKQRVVPLMDELGAEAEACGAVNTIIHRDGRLRGENSDVIGVRRALLEALPAGRSLAGRRAVVIGGGGSARAAALALLEERARVSIAVRSRQRIRDFASRHDLPLFPIDEKTFRLLVPDVIVHATPVGQPVAGAAGGPDALIRVEDIPPRCLVLDLVYVPARTELLDRARRAGAVPISGLAMFLHQAVAQIEWVLGSAAGLPGTETLSRLLGPAGRVLRDPKSPCPES